MMNVGTIVWAAGMMGYTSQDMRASTHPRKFHVVRTKTDASTTRRPLTPLTVRSGLSAPSPLLVEPLLPIATVPETWLTTRALARMYSSMASSVVAFAEAPNSEMIQSLHAFAPRKRRPALRASRIVWMSKPSSSLSNPGLMMGYVNGSVVLSVRLPPTQRPRVRVSNQGSSSEQRHDVRDLGVYKLLISVKK